MTPIVTTLALGLQKAVPEVCYTDSNPQWAYTPVTTAESATEESTVCSRMGIPSTSTKSSNFTKLRPPCTNCHNPFLAQFLLGRLVTKHTGMWGSNGFSSEYPFSQSLLLQLALAVINKPHVCVCFFFFFFFLLLDVKWFARISLPFSPNRVINL